MAKSKEYWRERIENEMKRKAEADLDIQLEYKKLHDHYIRQIENEINTFYIRYGNALAVDATEMRKMASEMDVQAFAEKAKRYVDEKDFSAEANEQLKIYNLKMRVSRHELLLYNIELEMVALSNDEFKMTEKYLNQEYVDEVRRQAGILGESVPEPETLRRMGQAIINTPFKGAEWSDSIWERQELLSSIVADITNEALIKGKNATTFVSELKREFGVNEYSARRLAITEMARIQTAVSKDSFERNGYDEYNLIEEPSACDICKEVARKGPYKVKDMMPGENSAPMHPFCKCANSPEAGRAKLDRMFEEYETIKKDGIMNETDEFQKTFEGFNINRNRRAMGNDALNRLGVPVDKISIKKADGVRGFNQISEDEKGIISIKEFSLQSNDNRTAEYQTKTLFHESYHAKMAGSTIDRNKSYGGLRWLDIEETFAETSSHYAVQAMGIEKKLSPAYPHILVDTLPRLKQLEKYQDASSLADFGKIAWEDRLKGMPSQWNDLARELDKINHDWHAYGLKYEPYIKNNTEALFTNFIENSPQYNERYIIDSMKIDLDNALRKAASNQPYTGNEEFVYSGILATAMNQIGVW